jgi:hypothetical protein
VDDRVAKADQVGEVLIGPCPLGLSETGQHKVRNLEFLLNLRVLIFTFVQSGFEPPDDGLFVSGDSVRLCTAATTSVIEAFVGGGIRVNPDLRASAQLA